MVEDRRHPVFEQRQPVIHARQAAAFGHGLIERVASCGDAKALAVASTETADRLFVHQRFDRRQQVEMRYLVNAALV